MVRLPPGAEEMGVNVGVEVGVMPGVGVAIGVEVGVGSGVGVGVGDAHAINTARPKSGRVRLNRNLGVKLCQDTCFLALTSGRLAIGLLNGYGTALTAEHLDSLSGEHKSGDQSRRNEHNDVHHDGEHQSGFTRNPKQAQGIDHRCLKGDGPSRQRRHRRYKEYATHKQHHHGSYFNVNV